MEEQALVLNWEISPFAGSGNAGKLQVGTTGAGEKCHWEEEGEELEPFRGRRHPVTLLRFLLTSHHVGSLGEFQMFVLGECSHSEWKDEAAWGGKLAKLSVWDTLARGGCTRLSWLRYSWPSTASRPERNLRMNVCPAPQKEEGWKVSKSWKSQLALKSLLLVLSYSLLTLGSSPLYFESMTWDPY